MPGPNELILAPHHIVEYKDSFLQAYQRSGAILLPHVSVDKASGDGSVAVNVFAKATTRRASDRGRDNPNLVTARQRRWVFPTDTIEWGEEIETEDMIWDARNPQSDLLMAGAEAVGRDVDEEIIKGMLAPAIEGRRPGATTSVAFKAGQTVATTVGATDGTTPTGLNPEKLRKAREIMAKGNVDLTRNQPVLLIDPLDMTELSRYEQLTSGDFYRTESERPYYVDGVLRRIMGFNLIEFNGLPASGGVRTNIAFIKSDVAVKEWKPVTPRAWHLTGKRNIPYVFADAIYGATRKRDEGVVKILNVAE